MLKRYGFRAVPFFLWRFSAENGRGGMRQKKRRRKSGESPVFPGGNDEGNVPDIRTARPFLQPEGRPLFVFMRYFREKRFQNTGAGPRTYSFLRGRFSMPGLLRRSARKGRGKLAFFCGCVAGQGCCGMVGCGRDFSAAPPRRQRKRFSAQTVAEGGIFQSVGYIDRKRKASRKVMLSMRPLLHLWCHQRDLNPSWRLERPLS